MRRMALLFALLLSACSPGSAPHDAVSADQMAAMHVGLKKQFARDYGIQDPNAHVGCAEKRLGARQSSTELVVYLWSLCDAWRSGSCVSKPPTSGVSQSVVAHLRGQTVVRWQVPADGEQNAKDIKAWFPESLRSAATFPGNATVAQLERRARMDGNC